MISGRCEFVNNMKILIPITFILAFAGFNAAQTVAPTVAPNECPPSFAVCLSRDESIKVNQKLDKLELLQTENTNLKENIIPGFKDELNKLRIEFAASSGELTATKAENIRLNARLDYFIQNQKSRKKCFLLCAIF